MGMLANFSYVDQTGALTMTTVQWSTMIDRILSEALRDHSNPHKALKRLFKKVTEFEHISALDTTAPADALIAEGLIAPAVSLPYGLYAHGVYTSFGPTRYTRKEVEKRGGVRNIVEEYHFEDGISVIVDANDPEKIAFGWAGDGIVWEDAKIEDLVKDGFRTSYHSHRG